MSNRGILIHERLGVVVIVIDRRIANVRAGWENDRVHVRMKRPQTEEKIRKFLDTYCDQLLQMRSQTKFHPGTSLICPGVEFRIVSSEKIPQGKATAYPNLPVTEICVGPGFDTKSAIANRVIKRLILASAQALAARLLLPRAKELAARSGLTVTEWKIGRGKRTLGTCDSNNRIILSSRLVFMPQELRDYVVLHELSHTVEHNHSARFHEVCNRLCGGREKELDKMLKEFRSPI